MNDVSLLQTEKLSEQGMLFKYLMQILQGNNVSRSDTE